jgi:hypothetical protein
MASAMHGQPQDVPRFRGGIDLVSVTATVTDGDGRFDLGVQERPVA